MFQEQERNKTVAVTPEGTITEQTSFFIFIAAVLTACLLIFSFSLVLLKLEIITV